MMDTTDMTTPVTRGELREEFAQFEQKIDTKLVILEQRIEQKFDTKIQALDAKVEQRLAKMATKTDLEAWGEALLARMTELFELSEQRRQLGEKRLHEELARHTNAIYESMSRSISVIDDKYNDLPQRVRQLEAIRWLPAPR